MKLRKFVTAGVALCAFVSIAACSDDGGSDDPTTTTTTSTTTDAGPSGSTSPGDLTDPKKPPTAAALNTMLETALDPKIPNTEKTELVEGSDADPEIFDKLIAGMKANPDVTYEIVAPVRPAGANQAKANVKINFPDQPQTQVEALIAYNEGRWKLSKTTVCLLLSGANEKSPMCPATS
ncbi:hypothetical protein DFJ75_1868 [Williamsia muralis]|uniref:Low molecular weight antigen MTB12-like C-terminal domain-containing protein n=1 Tax=Williamsia marianensis TaxID=85044 RepID=A0A495K3K6_WILMA|nr:hypothetical protein [Williamsia muralis]RKR95059.1 hypothetical protein DFJ75_1868 [Williamsia muralis]